MSRAEGGYSKEETARRTRTLLSHYRRIQRRNQRSTINDRDAYDRVRNAVGYEQLRDELVDEILNG